MTTMFPCERVDVDFTATAPYRFTQQRLADSEQAG